MGREDLLQKERQYHPDIKYGTTLDYQDMQKVYPEYFEYNEGGRVSYLDGGIVSLLKKK